MTVFAVNRHLEEALPLEVDLRSFGKCSLIEHIVLESDDLKASNTAAQPNRVAPHNRGGAVVSETLITASLAKASWNVIRLKVQ
ncbi:Intracellular exo-alpha-(1-_5)-L-arabinofuranosidase [compost metagenome]